MNTSTKPECFPCSAELKIVCQCGEILTIAQTTGVSTHRDQGTEVVVAEHECSQTAEFWTGSCYWRPIKESKRS